MLPNYRVPDAKKALKGTLQPSRSKRPVPAKPIGTVPKAPAGLSARARAEWQRLAPLAIEKRTMAESDLRAFQLLVDVLATVSEAQEAIGREGLTIRSGDTVRAHPAIKILEAARGQATRLLCEFGLTPRSRGHVEPTAEPQADNPFAGIA